jgi:hypothetical protein
LAAKVGDYVGFHKDLNPSGEEFLQPCRPCNSHLCPNLSAATSGRLIFGPLSANGGYPAHTSGTAIKSYKKQQTLGGPNRLRGKAFNDQSGMVSNQDAAASGLRSERWDCL